MKTKHKTIRILKKVDLMLQEALIRINIKHRKEAKPSRRESAIIDEALEIGLTDILKRLEEGKYHF